MSASQPQEQPDWVCRDCGAKYSRRAYQAGAVSVSITTDHISTWHEGTCDVCGQIKPVTQPRDFSYLKPEWKQHK
jgi:hypothetical protein